ncbi:MAG: phosphoribosyltransferase [Rhodocyclaceae bacterium]|nr:MAG: phosphoribosyltransferase [Rhodocyclaceae bacterium]
MNAGPRPFREMSAELMRGHLFTKVYKSYVEPESLFGFAERRNPKRAFLFVSKVLGRHIPVAPSVMQASFKTLAAKIPDDLPGPVLVMGMAETAVGLGAGVHRSLAKARQDTMYLVTTRHPTGTDLFAHFEEEHSHASSHLIHLPTNPVPRDMMLSARSLVLVDDEASTGKTFINLLASLREAGLDHVQRVVTVTLTDWSEGAVARNIGSHADSVALLEGSYVFNENPEASLPDMPEVGTVATGDWPLVGTKDWGRLGAWEHLDTLAPGLLVTEGDRILVVGTSEYVWRPFLLAERLEKQGARVQFGSTTRSPIALGHAIGCALAFGDNYGLGIPNFLYNVAPGQYDRVLICCETPTQSVDSRLVEVLNAEVISDAS